MKKEIPKEPVNLEGTTDHIGWYHPKGEPSNGVLRFHLPSDIRRRFKLACMMQDMSMSQCLRAHINKFIEESKNND